MTSDQDRYARWLAEHAPTQRQPPLASWLAAFLNRVHDGIVGGVNPVGVDAGPLTAALLLRFVVVDDDHQVRLTPTGFRRLTDHTVAETIARRG